MQQLDPIVVNMAGTFTREQLELLDDARDAASDQGRITWITDEETGKRLAAIVPADVAEDAEARVSEALSRIREVAPGLDELMRF